MTGFSVTIRTDSQDSQEIDITDRLNAPINNLMMMDYKQFILEPYLKKSKGTRKILHIAFEQSGKSVGPRDILDLDSELKIIYYPDPRQYNVPDILSDLDLNLESDQPDLFEYLKDCTREDVLNFDRPKFVEIFPPGLRIKAAEIYDLLELH